MGYFSNGTESGIYQNVYCKKCVHDINDDCQVWLLHSLYNYDECNNDESFLHDLIPRSKDGGNEKCTMFWEAK